MKPAPLITSHTHISPASHTTPLVSIDDRYADTRLAFDSVAADYDGPMGNNALVERMRDILWQTIQRVVRPGARLLDLGCGTGLDATHFAQLGYAVTAIDWSGEMVAQARRRAERAGVSRRLRIAYLGIQELNMLQGEMGTFDLIYSDLGALNCLPDLDEAAQACAMLLRAGGYMACSVIGRYCPWELAYYGLRGNLQRARVRFSKDQVPVSLNGYTVWTRYYSPREFYGHFPAQFQWRTCQAINLFLPPPYMYAFYERHPALFRRLAWLDEHVTSVPVLNQAGDHFLLVMERHG